MSNKNTQQIVKKMDTCDNGGEAAKIYSMCVWKIIAPILNLFNN